LADRITDPIMVPASFWQRPDTAAALRSRDVCRLFHLLRQYAGASQTRLAIACGLTQGKVSTIMSGTRQVTALDVFERIADGLDMPGRARFALGLAPAGPDPAAAAIPPWDAHRPQPPTPAPGTPMVDSPGPDEAEDPVQTAYVHPLGGG
jgi:hypothetical protein